MFNTGFVPASFFWPFMSTIAVLILTGLVVLFLIWWFSKRGSITLSHYIRKPFLFDSKAEFDLFKILVELYGDTYYIFPQVHYCHLVQPRRDLSFNERRAFRSRIDRKSADFVLCEKVQVTVQLIIELDGPTHDLPVRHKRDEFINEITRVARLKIVHLKVQDLKRDLVRHQIDHALALCENEGEN